MLNTQTNTNDFRALSSEEIDSVSGGVGWFVAAIVLVSAAAVGVGAALLTATEDALTPTIGGGGSPEEPGTKVQGTAKDGISKPRRPV